MEKGDDDVEGKPVFALNLHVYDGRGGDGRGWE